MFANRLRKIASPAARGLRRNFSGHGSPEEVKAGMEWWKKVTYVTLPLVGVALGANLIMELTHSAHGGEGPVYTYNKIRNKPYPWGNGDCNFFDLKCRRG